uniref:60S ribosome subunit biogenesis protein NIP7 homolog n=1 Tax=Arcella intermedia TaxID=1963864 RepID=A0A6B2LKV1_9EUKA|eukprot:TRINITY_DN553_c0_g1_i1.p1 TRINITY_DN553_c0_g1~~TRINITY_DN553_c0_g1_i1.p1  ORF type:complete len:181 (-),score=36.11 TRINITY_DN553_c0_g1_i1:97-639(-)
MRPLTEEETKVFFEKLAKYIGRNIKYLIERKDETYCFRLHKNRVYYLSEKLVHKAEHVANTSLVSLGVCMGKFTKAGKFKLHITCLDILAQYARYKIWIKPSGELSFLYGNNILKAAMGRITQDTPQYQGVVVFSMADIPLGFGVMAKSTQDCRGLGPEEIVCFNQADLGEYLREEQTLL